MKKIFGRSRARYILAISSILLSVLLIGYLVIVPAPRVGAQAANAPSRAAVLDDRDPELMKKRQQYLERFFGGGPGGVSPREYALGLAAARRLPRSPFLQGGEFMPQIPEGVWGFPISPPITNSYGGDATARVQAIAIDPTTNNVVYTGSFGGVAKTTDGGSTWQYLTNAWTSQNVNCIAIDYNRLYSASHNYIYVGTGSDDYYGPSRGVGLYRSFDGGQTWSGPLGAAQFSATAIASIATVGSGSQSNATLYLTNLWPRYDYFNTHSTGLWRSTDSGASWTLLRPRGDAYGSGIYDVVVDTNPSILYIAEDDGAFKSTDSGQNWTKIHDCARDTNGNCVLGSPDSLSVAPLGSPALYLMQPADVNHNFYKSTDQGSSWAQIQTKCPPGADSCAGSQIGFTVFAVSPRSPQTILAGGYGGIPYGNGTLALFRTTDGGANWAEIGHWYGPDIHTDQHFVVFSPDGTVAYEGNDGGIVKTTDTGQHWINLNHNFSGALLYSVALSANGSVIAGTQDSGAAYSDGGIFSGTPLNMIYGGDSSHDLIEPVGNTWAYFEIYDPSDMYRFNRVTSEITNIASAVLIADRACAFFPAFNMNPSSPTHLVAGCQHLVRTFNATATPVVWTTIGGVVAGGTSSITDAYEAPSDSNVIYAITTPYDDPGYSSSVMLTTNANSGTAATWSNITPSLAGHLQAVTVHPTDPRTAYVAGSKAIYKTTDMGASWTQIATPNLVYHDVEIDPAMPQDVFAAANAGVFSSTDGGLTWSDMTNGIPLGMAVTSLSINTARSQIAAATFGRGIYTNTTRLR